MDGIDTIHLVVRGIPVCKHGCGYGAVNMVGSHSLHEFGMFVLQEELQPAIDDKLVNNSREQQHCTLDTLRQLHAVARPELLVSHLKVGSNT